VAFARQVEGPDPDGFRLCGRCGETVPQSEWAPSRSCCRLCRRAYEREYKAAWRAAEPEAAEAWRLKHRLAEHGVTPERWVSILETQGGGCAICGAPADVDRRLAVDHDHDCCPKGTSCGLCVRGALCGNCNKGLGCFQDDARLLRAAIEYLARGWFPREPS
jgi:hypothetical protein